MEIDMGNLGIANWGGRITSVGGIDITFETNRHL
jgi:hypothetical protein